MMIINKKKMTATIIKYPRVFVIINATVAAIGLYILIDVAMAYTKTEMFGTYGFIGLIMSYYGINRLNKVSGHIVSAFRGRR